MDERFKELTDRLVAPGNPLTMFSCSELHELHDYIMAGQKRVPQPVDFDKLRVTVEYNPTEGFSLGRMTSYISIDYLKQKAATVPYIQNAKSVCIEMVQPSTALPKKKAKGTKKG